MERGTVRGRVALLLRSAEVKPLFYRFVQQMLNSSLFPYHRRTSGQVQLDLVLWSGDALGEMARAPGYHWCVIGLLVGVVGEHAPLLPGL